MFSLPETRHRRDPRDRDGLNLKDSETAAPTPLSLTEAIPMFAGVFSETDVGVFRRLGDSERHISLSVSLTGSRFSESLCGRRGSQRRRGRIGTARAAGRPLQVRCRAPLEVCGPSESLRVTPSHSE